MNKKSFWLNWRLKSIYIWHKALDISKKSAIIHAKIGLKTLSSPSSYTCVSWEVRAVATWNAPDGAHHDRNLLLWCTSVLLIIFKCFCKAQCFCVVKRKSVFGNIIHIKLFYCFPFCVFLIIWPQIYELLRHAIYILKISTFGRLDFFF